ncbi:hypothetical protein [Mesobacillus stamsii]|uniref:Uncharacterized protein n=1 Tax=Mesobacillus stamsii TaxID=225347 RepID=A0ABU0FU24_9BACI|nr:hypothetical protein [Mesobacillus stamsii]MDQ0412883.1 hypothetical protein [Mesobacillus stamsii]
MQEPSLFAAKLFDDNKRIDSYSNQLLELIKKQFRTRTIDKYDYERFINLLTCLKLQTEESRKDINDFIKETNHYTSIDVRV